MSDVDVETIDCLTNCIHRRDRHINRTVELRDCGGMKIKKALRAGSSGRIARDPEIMPDNNAVMASRREISRSGNGKAGLARRKVYPEDGLLVVIEIYDEDSGRLIVVCRLVIGRRAPGNRRRCRCVRGPADRYSR